MLWQVFKVVAVISIVLAAAIVATPPGRLPLALRGLHRIMRRDSGLPDSRPAAKTSAARRFVAFLLVLLAVVVAAI
ncbi:MAG: hypothetical protein K6F50_03365 [Kiritimatiellae bacterium]|nr:hypothetical protein [Kiritimatiellia bacterium]